MQQISRWICVAMALCVATAAQAETTVRIALSSLPPGSGDPFTSVARTAAYTYRAIFDTLTQLDAGMVPSPALALSWRSTDTLTWQVSLRPGVTFSNGEPFNAATVIFAYTYLQSTDGATEPLARETENIATVRALDPLTVEFKTRQPDPAFARQLAVIPMVAPEQWRKAGRDGFARAPVGTGPFAVETWDEARISLRAFRQSWRAPKTDRLEIIALPDPAGRVQALLSERVDIASELGPEAVESVTAAGFASYQRPASSVNVIAFNTVKAGSPFKDARVRQALSYAVNRDAIAKAILHDLVPPASQVTPRSNPAYDADLKPYPYDPAKAKALLAEAGYPKGFNFVHEMPNGTDGTDADIIVQQIAQDLAGVGVRMEIRPIPWAQFVRNVYDGGWQGDSFRFEYETLPTGDVLRPFRLHSCLWPQPWYCDHAIMPAIAEAKTTFDPARRKELMAKILAHYHNQAAALVLFEPLGLDGLSRKVTGYSQANGIIPYDLLGFSPARQK